VLRRSQGMGVLMPVQIGRCPFHACLYILPNGCPMCRTEDNAKQVRGTLTAIRGETYVMPDGTVIPA
jgi:hypothetical protein